MLTEYVKGNSRVQLVNIDTGFVQVNNIHHPPGDWLRGCVLRNIF